MKELKQDSNNKETALLVDGRLSIVKVPELSKVI